MNQSGDFFRISVLVTFVMGLKSSAKTDMRTVVLSEYLMKHIVLP